jgi:hypothetical protein
MNFYLTDYVTEGANALLKEAILSLVIDNYHNFIIYIHNLSFFDGREPLY